MKNKCSCPYCENELKHSCLSPSFCSPCHSQRNADKNIKVCPDCGAEYAAEYKQCPACKGQKDR
ncbi:MAG: hypothetical protein LBB93_00060 [Elusimicrobiota bacterium]|nr:hypothetical protein [Elusimicrobiota bacterium]